MDVYAVNRSMLSAPEAAVALIPSGSRLAMGMAMAEPPSLLGALADRARAEPSLDLRLYYYEATAIACDTMLDYALPDHEGLTLDAVPLSQDLFAASEVDVGGREVVEALVSPAVIVVLDEGR